MEETTKATVAKATEELKAVLECRRKLDDGQWITLRFVKCQNLAPSERYNNFSSTDVREVMRRQEGIKLKEALDWMALSADLLWRCKASWIDEARLGVNFCINFQPSTEDLLSLEEPPSYEDPPSYDDPPSLEELDRVKNIKASPLVEEPPLLEYSTPYDVSPSIQEPQTTEEHPLLEYSSPHDVTLSIKEPQTLEALQVREETSGTLDKKRHFSETGLEAEAEITGNSVGGGCLAEDAKV